MPFMGFEINARTFGFQLDPSVDGDRTTKQGTTFLAGPDGASE